MKKSKFHNFIVFMLIFALQVSFVCAQEPVKQGTVQAVQAQDADEYDIDFSKYDYNEQKELNPEPVKEIKDFLKNYKKYTEKQNFKRVSDLYGESYINNDGYDKKTALDFMKKGWESHPAANFKIKIKDIKINGDYAQVLVSEFSSERILGEKNTIERCGDAKSTSEILLGLQKQGLSWKLISEEILSEQMSLTYADAGFFKMNLSAPFTVAENSTYLARLTVDVPLKYVVFASVNNTEIKQSQIFPEELFKNLTEQGYIERALIANSGAKNEYAVASVGITEPKFRTSLKSPDTINIVGIAFLWTRVNVLKDAGTFAVEKAKK